MGTDEYRRLKNIYFTIEDIEKAIKETRSEAPGPSGISPKLAKKTCKSIAPMLYQLFKKILKERKIPSINLLSLISPLLKPGKDASKPSSYRPVSLTELWMRILEKVLKKKLQEHAERLGLLSKDQHSFRRMKSTRSNLLEHHQRIVNALERGESVDAIYVDLPRVFDSRLIRKLKK